MLLGYQITIPCSHTISFVTGRPNTKDESFRPSPDFVEMFRSSSSVACRAVNALLSRNISHRAVTARLARCASTSTPSPAAEILSKPPRTIEDSTSALDYKFSHRRARPPPLPATDAPRPMSAEEAVTNILYNTPPPSNEPYKK